MATYRKKLIEVALPLEAINEASRREKSPFTKDHPRALHVWWARRPLAACRAALFASLVDDPSSLPDEYPTEESQEKERQRLFQIMEQLVKWENTYNSNVLQAARSEISKSTGDARPVVYDPFCGGGSIPLEAQRLGLESYASDLNPVAVLITKALIEVPSKFANHKPINPQSKRESVTAEFWPGLSGLSEDVLYYGRWIRKEAENRIGHLYPKVKLPPEQGGARAIAIAWLWARTVECPNPACGAQMPLVRSFWLSTKKGKEAWVRPVVDKSKKSYEFSIESGAGSAPEGTVNRKGAHCIVCGSPVQFDYIRRYSREVGLGQKLMSIVAEGARSKVFCQPQTEHEYAANSAKPCWKPEGEIVDNPGHTNVYRYGLTQFSDLFTPRQLAALSTFSDLVLEAREQVFLDSLKAGAPDDGRRLNDGGVGSSAYADAVATYLGLAVSRFTDFSNSICSWDAGNTNMRQLFARQAIPMAWDYAESNPLHGVVGIDDVVTWTTSAFRRSIADCLGQVQQADATTANPTLANPMICTDPPYYDNIGYADLSDFFYVWLRRCLSKVYPELFGTMLVPKAQELVATAYRFDGDRREAKEFFEKGLLKAFNKMAACQTRSFPLTLFYAFKQAEAESEESDESRSSLIASTGWETMLEALLKAGFQITGTWPMRTEQQQRSVAVGANALASSIVLVCRPRDLNAPVASRREFLTVLKRELPLALRTLQRINIAPVDLAQASIGPGMAIFSRYVGVIESDGARMSVRTALTLINQTLDEVLNEQEGEFDADTRFCLAWFEQHGMSEGQFGVADVLARAKDTAVSGLVDAGVIYSRAGKVRLLRREEYDEKWDPIRDKRLTAWEVAQNLIRVLDKQGEKAAAALAYKVGGLGEIARDLAYRLYSICERKKWAQEALAYNSLVIAWPEIVKLASAGSRPTERRLFE
jgi:putative DNA methylase